MDKNRVASPGSTKDNMTGQLVSSLHKVKSNQDKTGKLHEICDLVKLTVLQSMDTLPLGTLTFETSESTSSSLHFSKFVARKESSPIDHGTTNRSQS